MRKNSKRTDFIIVAVILLLVAAGILFAVITGNNSSSPQVPAEKIASYTDYNGKKIGIMTGTSFEVPTFEFFPDSQYFYYNNASDMAAALVQGKIDGFLGDEPQMRMLCQEQDGITYIKQKLTEEDYAFGFLNLRLLYATIATQNIPCSTLYKNAGYAPSSPLTHWTLESDAVFWLKMNK